MGTWGPAIFSDDEAADVRDNFKLYLADQQDVSAATDAIAADYGASFDHPEWNTAFWLGLALTQWTAGWLDGRVQEIAFRVIDDDSDLKKWTNPAQRRRRAVALSAARERLASAQRPAKPIPRPWPTQLADFKIGEIIARRVPNGRVVIMKVINFRPTHAYKVRGPAVRVQHWLSLDLPSPEEAANLEYIRHPLRVSKRTTFGSYVLTGPRFAPLDPEIFIRPGIIVPVGLKEAKISYGTISAQGTVDEALTAAMDRFWEDPTLTAEALPPWC